MRAFASRFDDVRTNTPQAMLSFGDYARHLTDEATVTFMGSDRAVAARAQPEAVAVNQENPRMR